MKGAGGRRRLGVFEDSQQGVNQVASRQLQVVVTDSPAAAIKDGVVLIEQLDIGARELWDAILRDFRPTSIPTWTAGKSLSSDWVGTLGAVEVLWKCHAS